MLFESRWLARTPTLLPRDAALGLSELPVRASAAAIPSL